jgi:hypothetical protein
MLAMPRTADTRKTRVSEMRYFRPTSMPRWPTGSPLTGG